MNHWAKTCRNILFLAVFWSVGVACADLLGVFGKTTLCVQDESGRPVEGAKIVAHFRPDDDSPTVFTTKDGLAILAGRTVFGDMSYVISKDGYYTTRSRIHFDSLPGARQEFGRWLPWNTTNTVILKTRKKPIAGAGRRVAWRTLDGFVPASSLEGGGYDFLIGDWVAPFGRGEQADVIFRFVPGEERTRTVSTALGPVALRETPCKLVLNFTGNGNGFIRRKKDMWSHFWFDYTAPSENYGHTLVLRVGEREDFQPVAWDFGEDEYLIARFRTRYGKNGDMESCRYGIVDGPLRSEWTGEGRILEMHYWLNPSENDSNLEQDNLQTLGL